MIFSMAVSEGAALAEKAKVRVVERIKLVRIAFARFETFIEYLYS